MHRRSGSLQTKKIYIERKIWRGTCNCKHLMLRCCFQLVEQTVRIRGEAKIQFRNHPCVYCYFTFVPTQKGLLLQFFVAAGRIFCWSGYVGPIFDGPPCGLIAQLRPKMGDTQVAYRPYFDPDSSNANYTPQNRE